MVDSIPDINDVIGIDLTQFKSWIIPVIIILVLIIVFFIVKGLRKRRSRVLTLKSQQARELENIWHFIKSITINPLRIKHELLAYKINQASMFKELTILTTSKNFALAKFLYHLILFKKWILKK